MSYAIEAKVVEVVTLTNDHGGVNKNKIKVSRGTEVTWSSSGHGHAKLVFDKKTGSPFASDTFYVPINGSVTSGPVIKGGSGEEFKYTVRGEKGDNDPVIVVDP